MDRTLLQNADADTIASLAAAVAPACQAWSVRFRHSRGERLSVRRDIVDPPMRWEDAGVMVTVSENGGTAHAALGAPDSAGLQQAFQQALDAAAVAAKGTLLDASALPSRGLHARFQAMPKKLLPESFAERLDIVRQACRALDIDDRIIDRAASLSSEETRQVIVDHGGTQIEQVITTTVPDQRATARAHGQVQTRTRAGQGNGIGRQGGAEVLDEIDFIAGGRALANEALALTGAPNCPDGVTDLILMPDQMMLQIHESIGHPLELDRILGDERNFAGGSFVTLDMFGHYQYGSEHLNVSFAPDVPGELASFGFDDDGLAAQRTMLIEQGRLVRALGGRESAHRAGQRGIDLPALACSRASNWNRPVIDRMANLNIEPGEHSLAELIGAVESGILMQTNVSWSIDDRRDKFQFGCEMGHLIRNGELGPMVRNPNYRGRSATFWRALAAVGNAESFARFGTPYCGKGEPMQIVPVGHASPACLFRGVDVFGAQA